LNLPPGAVALPNSAPQLPLFRRELTARLFDRLVIGAVVSGFLILMAAGAATAWVVRENQVFGQAVTHTVEVQTAVAEIQVLAERIEAARRGGLIVDNPGFARVIATTEAALPAALSRLTGLTSDNPRQQNRVATIGSLLSQQHSAILSEGALLRAGRRDEALLLFTSEAARVIRALRAESQAMLDEEQRLLAERSRAQMLSRLLLYAVLGLAALLIVLVGVGSVFVIFRYTHDLAASRDRLRALNAGLEDAVRERTADLTRANDEIQRFAYIVSHDLRSPLVNVMGFTSELESAAKPLRALVSELDAKAPDLVSVDAREAVERDLPEAIGFIRTSTQKMDGLINAILRLSREGRRVMTPEPLEMEAVIRSLGDTLTHSLQEAGAELVIEPALPPLHADRLAVEQIFGNLMGNAVKYLKPGRPGRIVVRGREEAGRLIYEVQDNGRGIAPKDHERVFELFRRSGTQDQPGEGIGLAHVRALAYRLGGFITCDSDLDQGATFRLSLPRQPVS
jgi:signal transduction histidine kinase